MTQNLPLQLAQLRARLQAQVAGELVARPLEAVERVGLAPAAVEREHQLPEQAFP